jgi:stage II sporulation protein D
MKRKLGPLILFALLIALVPALALLAGSETPQTGTAPPSQTAQPEPGDEPSAGVLYEGGTLTVFDEATGQPLTLSEREYLLGAVMCEMPALYEPEALKAQVVACHTYALCVQSMRQSDPDPALMGAAFAVNSETLTGYMTKERAQQIYGARFEEYYTKMEQAVDAVLRDILTYNGEPISACYHAISPGRTEASENIFVTALPYLVSVDSSYDKTAEGYLSTATFTPGELEDVLRLYDKEFTRVGETAQWLGDAQVSEAGTVLSQRICGRDYAGTTLREIFGLRSPAFELRYDGEQFVFEVKGYGHGVGMSQNGANGLAKEGKTYVEILAHYYPGAVLTQLD